MELKDITTIEIDQNLTKEQKIAKLIEELQDPYKFKVGNVTVNVAFDKNGETLQEMMLQYFKKVMI